MKIQTQTYQKSMPQTRPNFTKKYVFDNLRRLNDDTIDKMLGIEGIDFAGISPAMIVLTAKPEDSLNVTKQLEKLGLTEFFARGKRN